MEDIAKWVIGAIVALGVVWAPVACTKINNDKIAEAIAQGVSPIEAECTYSVNRNIVNCALAITKGAK